MFVINIHVLNPSLAGDPDSDELMAFWLKKGAPQRCGCGNWFKLMEIDEMDDIPI